MSKPFRMNEEQYKSLTGTMDHIADTLQKVTERQNNFETILGRLVAEQTVQHQAKFAQIAPNDATQLNHVPAQIEMGPVQGTNVYNMPDNVGSPPPEANFDHVDIDTRFNLYDEIQRDQVLSNLVDYYFNLYVENLDSPHMTSSVPPEEFAAKAAFITDTIMTSIVSDPRMLTSAFNLASTLRSKYNYGKPFDFHMQRTQVPLMALI